MIISFFAQKGGDYSREGDYEGGDYFKYCSLEVILFYYAIKLKNNHIELTEHGPSVPNLVPWLIFVAWIITYQSRMNHIALQLDREGIKGREDDERSGGEAIILNISVQEGWLFNVHD